jgi:hypothetical protein
MWDLGGADAFLFALALARFEDAHVLEVAGTSRCTLGRDEIRPRHDEESLALVGHRLTACPRLGKRQTRRSSLDVDPDAVAEDGDLVCEEVINVRQRRRAEACRLERFEQPGGVLLRRVDQDVEIERGPGDTVQNGGNPPDDDVPNVVGGEGREYGP